MSTYDFSQMLLLRTEETARRYEEAQKQKKAGGGCRLCNDPDTIEEYTHWRLMPNMFPYDRFCDRSDMLVTKRHVDESGLNEEERKELFELKSTVLGERYHSAINHLPKMKSIPHHCHIHVVRFRAPV